MRGLTFAECSEWNPLSFSLSGNKPLSANTCIFSERELMFTFAICRRPSVCLSVCLSSVTFVHPTQPIEIFGNVSAPCNTLVT